MQIPPALLTLLLGMALVLGGLWIGTNVSLLPLDASSNAPVYDALFRVLFSIGAVLFIGIAGLLLFSLVRFRRRSGDNADGEPIEGNLPLEILWTAVPAVVVLFIGIYSYDIYDQMGGMTPLNDHSAMHHHDHAADSGGTASAASVTSLASAQQAGEAGGADQARIWGGIGPTAPETGVTRVDVTAMQFAFIFHYPGAEIISGELHVPADRPVELRMEARDVIHAFWVPQFRLKQDVIPGQPTLLSFTPTRPGTYPIICAELCGPYHGGMRSNVVVHEPDEFNDWLVKNTPAASAALATAQLNPLA